MPEQGKQPEPWLRGTLTDIEPVARAVLHSLEMAREDAAKWCADLNDREFSTAPFQLLSPAAHLRHIAGSLERFVTYADGRVLTSSQLAALTAEKQPAANREEVLSKFAGGLDATAHWLLVNRGKPLETPLKIGRKGLPTTLGGLLVHMAEHTQRHVGQLVTTAKLLVAQRTSELREPGASGSE